MRGLRGIWCVAALCALFMAACLPAPAQAHRSLITKALLETRENEQIPPPEGQIEGACGIAVAPNGNLYVSDYYHSLVDVFSPSGGYIFQFAVNPLDGVCQLAFDSAGTLYANEWHESVMRLKPSLQVFDEDSSTGVAVDGAGNVYANDRTRIVVYAPSGALIEEFGGGSLEDAYGLAVSGDRVYVPDAATGTVKVFEPSKPVDLVGAIAPSGGFTSLVDASVAVDPTNGHVLVLDNLQPGFEHPKGAIDEFAADGTFLGQLSETVIDAGPSGIAVDGTGKLLVTSGNSEKANVFAFGPYTASPPSATDSPAEPPGASVAGPPAPGSPEAAGQSSPRTSAGTAGRNGAQRRRHRSRGGRIGLERARPAVTVKGS
jgi:hypothetical protein